MLSKLFMTSQNFLTRPIRINREITFLGKCKVFFLVMIAFYSVMPYFLWNKTTIFYGFNFMALAFAFLQGVLNENYDRTYISKQNIVSFSILILFFTWWHILYFYILNANIFRFISQFIFFLLPVAIFILSTESEKRYFLRYFTNFFVVIGFISLLFFFLYLAGVSLPHSKLYHPTSLFYDYFDNYRFFVIVRGGTDIPIFFRFQSIYTEPGHLGMMCALLLYANEYKFKKFKNLVLLICLILSLSLAAYALLVCGILLYNFFSTRKKIFMILVLIFLSAILIVSGMAYYNSNPDSVFSQLILKRLTFDEDKGIAGNNRNTDSFKKIYDEFKKDTFKHWFGSGTTVSTLFPKGGNSSYKNFILEHGIFGLLLLVAFYLSFAVGKKSGIMLGAFLLWAASFLQRPYADWISQIFIFIGYCSEVHGRNIADERELDVSGDNV